MNLVFENILFKLKNVISSILPNHKIFSKIFLLCLNLENYHNHVDDRLAFVKSEELPCEKTHQNLV